MREKPERLGDPSLLRHQPDGADLRKLARLLWLLLLARKATPRSAERLSSFPELKILPHLSCH